MAQITPSTQFQSVRPDLYKDLLTSVLLTDSEEKKLERLQDKTDRVKDQFLDIVKQRLVNTKSYLFDMKTELASDLLPVYQYVVARVNRLSNHISSLLTERGKHANPQLI